MFCNRNKKNTPKGLNPRITITSVDQYIEVAGKF